MNPVAILTFGATSALGEGDAAVSVGAPGEAARCAHARDEALAARGLARPFSARAWDGGGGGGTHDRSTALLLRALDQCVERLDGVAPGWRTRRVGLVLGTSGGAMEAAEPAFAAMARGEGLPPCPWSVYGAPFAAAAASLPVALAPASLVLGACASSTLAIGLASRWLEGDACDLVFAGGFDAVSLFVAAGFEALHATSATGSPNPFREGRDGMVLGEGAAVLALSLAAAQSQSSPSSRPTPLAYVAGFGASADGVHLTAPARDGDGVYRAARGALRDAGVDPTAVHLVGAHATATPFNDAAEARAIARAVGDVPVHPFKAQIGHALGAAGALEALACVDALRRGVVPAAAGRGPVDADAAVRLVDRNGAGTPSVALKLSSAFGGANAALVITRERRSKVARPVYPVHASRAVRAAPGAFSDLASLAARLDCAVERLARGDALVHRALAAVAALEDEVGDLDGAGIVVGESTATLETNALFFRRVVDKGARFAEPRRFPYTSPNAVAGECGVFFGLRGPGFAVGSGCHGALEALCVAHRLVASGDAERIVVVGVDDVGPMSEALPNFPRHLVSGAIAMLVSRNPRGGRGRVVSAVVGFRTDVGDPTASSSSLAGHRALEPLLEPAWPRHVTARCPSGGWARVELDPATGAATSTSA